MKKLPPFPFVTSENDLNVILDGLRKAWDGLLSYLRAVPVPDGLDAELVDVTFTASGRDVFVPHSRGRAVDNAFVGSIRAYDAGGARVVGQVTILDGGKLPAKDGLWLTAHWSAPIARVSARVLVCGR